VRVYFDNVWTRNGDGPAIRASIAAADADVVALVQVSGRNEAAVRQALSAYPYLVEGRPAFDRRGPRRILVASRYPLKAAPGAVVGASEPGFPVEVGAPAPFRLVVVHLQRPWPYHGQDEHFAALRRDLGPAPERTVLAGDFNATLTSAALRRFRRAAGLRALPATVGDWPSFLPPPLRLPIENVLAGRTLAVSGRRFAPPNGSDHRPIVFDVSAAAR
jgi:endonuclease/exonuclease/phosphatase (EEP) superfamily protein YafD